MTSKDERQSRSRRAGGTSEVAGGGTAEASRPPSARRSRRAFDRDEALDSALKEFWTHGYEATSIASLTKAMGINPPSLYAAFGDKRQLFDEVVQLYQQRAYRSTPSADDHDARTAIHATLRQLAADYTDPRHPPGCLIITAATNCGPDSQDVKTKLRALREEAKEAIAARIRQDVEARRLPPDTDAESLASFYSTVIQGMSQQATDGASRDVLEGVADSAMLVWPGARG